MTLPVHVALVDESETVDMAELTEVAGALNEQLQSDFLPVWRLTPATVGAYPKAPFGTWAIRLRKNIGEPGALGYHADAMMTPYSLVDVDAGNWTVTASHELLEMLADPWGNRRHRARLVDEIEDDWEEIGLPRRSSYVQYLLEVCDPPEATSYMVGGIAMSDFVLHSWYRTNPDVRPAYSFAGGCLMPRQVAPGGYVSFVVPETEVWWQVFADREGNLELVNIGRFNSAKYWSLREFTDHHARAFRAKQD